MQTNDANLTTVTQLVGQGLVPAENGPALEQVAARYALAITPAIAALIDRQDPNDPISRQFIPDVQELIDRPGERGDPIGDLEHSPVNGIVHRYTDRVLLKMVSICPVYCRFCFRREMIGPQSGGILDADSYERARAYIAAHREIEEVIVTGGDPLILSPRRVASITADLTDNAHISKIRWHSRVPVVNPKTITPELVQALQTDRANVRIAVHTNHRRELTPDAVAACERLSGGGIGLISQSVLLSGVNDKAETLADLMRGCVAAGIAPYYLHHGDLAPGTAHFRTSIARGREIWRQMHHVFPEHLVPKYVLDIPGGYGKVPLDDEHITLNEDGSYTVTDPYGRQHVYRDLLGSG